MSNGSNGKVIDLSNRVEVLDSEQTVILNKLDIITDNIIMVRDESAENKKILKDIMYKTLPELTVRLDSIDIRLDDVSDNLNSIGNKVDLLSENLDDIGEKIHKLIIKIEKL